MFVSNAQIQLREMHNPKNINANIRVLSLFSVGSWLLLQRNFEKKNKKKIFWFFVFFLELWCLAGCKCINAFYCNGPDFKLHQTNTNNNKTKKNNLKITIQFVYKSFSHNISTLFVHVCVFWTLSCSLKKNRRCEKIMNVHIMFILIDFIWLIPYEFFCSWRMK